MAHYGRVQNVYIINTPGIGEAERAMREVVWPRAFRRVRRYRPVGGGVLCVPSLMHGGTQSVSGVRGLPRAQQILLLHDFAAGNFPGTDLRLSILLTFLQ